MEGFHSRHDTADATVEISSGVATVGEAIEFEIELTTMDANTVVRDLTLELEVPYRTTEGYRRATIDCFTLADERSVDSGITTTRTTTGTVPEETPGTFGSVDVWARVAFDLDGTPVKREEYFDLAPSPQFRAVFEAMLSLGFAPRTFECLTDPTAGSEPFVRRFEFRPVDDPFDERLDELELFVRAHPEGYGSVRSGQP